MGFSGALVTLGISIVVAAYFYYGIVKVPDDMDARDDVMWVYAKRKYTRTFSTIGEYLGLGNRVVLSRAVSQILSTPTPENATGVKISDADFGGIHVRLYEPKGQVNNGPAMVWIHGGGWVIATVESDDGLMSQLADRLDILIVSVDYRLAPEHPFPAAVDDCLAATLHFMDNSKKYNVNKDRIAIGGASAGGNLAAAVALKMRDDKSPFKLEHQILVVPCLQAFDFTTPSYQLNDDSGYLPTDWMIHYWMLYGFGYDGNANLVSYAHGNGHTSIDAKISKLAQYTDHNLLNQKHIHQSFVPSRKGHGDEVIWNRIKDVFTNPYFAPLMADDLTGLPDAYIITAEYDILRDDGLMYAKRLSKAGNKVTVRNYEHSFHAVLHSWKFIQVSKNAMNELVSYLAKRL